MHVKVYISVKMYKWDYKLQWTKTCGSDDRTESTKLSREAVNENEFLLPQPQCLVIFPISY